MRTSIPATDYVEFGIAYILAGWDPVGARALVDGILAVDPDGQDEITRTPILQLLAVAAVRAELERLLANAPLPSQDWSQSLHLAILAFASAVAGDAELSRRVADALSPLADGMAVAGIASVQGPVDCFLAMALGCAGDTAAARAAADRGEAMAREWGSPRSSTGSPSAASSAFGSPCDTVLRSGILDSDLPLRAGGGLRWRRCRRMTGDAQHRADPGSDEGPRGYRLQSTLDLRDDRRAARAIQAAFGGTVAVMVVAAVVLDLPMDGPFGPLLTTVFTVASCLAYMALHELTHALLLWVLTRERPRWPSACPTSSPGAGPCSLEPRLSSSPGAGGVVHPGAARIPAVPLLPRGIRRPGAQLGQLAR